MNEYLRTSQHKVYIGYWVEREREREREREGGGETICSQEDIHEADMN